MGMGTRVRTRTRRGSCAREARAERSRTATPAFGSTSRVVTTDDRVARTFQALLAQLVLQEGLRLVRALLAGH
jgi:hypothetical protein